MSVINLITSRKLCFKDVLVALGSNLTNKYAEVILVKDIMEVNEIIDKVENLCIEKSLNFLILNQVIGDVNAQLLSGHQLTLHYIALLYHQIW